MKTTFMAALFLMTSASAFAKPADLPECKDITTACESKGYDPGEHKKNGKGLWVDCVGAIAKGGKIDGVNFTPVQAQACQTAAKAMRKHK